MNKLRICFAILIATFICQWGFAQDEPLRVSILGDSYSTFQGYIPEGNAIWYGTEKPYSRNLENDVTRVDDTWWYQLINRHGLKL